MLPRPGESTNGDILFASCFSRKTWQTTCGSSPTCALSHFHMVIHIRTCGYFGAAPWLIMMTTMVLIDSDVCETASTPPSSPSLSIRSAMASLETSLSRPSPHGQKSCVIPRRPHVDENLESNNFRQIVFGKRPALSCGLSKKVFSSLQDDIRASRHCRIFRLLFVTG